MNKKREERFNDLTNRFTIPIIATAFAIAGVIGISYRLHNEKREEPRVDRVCYIGNKKYILTDVDGDNSPDGIKIEGRKTYDFVATGYQDKLPVNSETREMSEGLRFASTRWWSVQGELEGCLK